MASNDYEIVNLALINLGANTITALDDGSKNGTIANKVYSTIRDEVLKAHPWNFATRRAFLSEVVPNSLTLTDISQADPGVVTYTGTDPEDGDKYEISDVAGMTEVNGNQYVIANVNTTAKTFELAETDTSGYTAYSSGGSAEKVIPKTDEWAYIYELPSDCLMVLEVNNDNKITFERSELGLMCNENPVSIVYIKQITTVSAYPSDFVTGLACRLSSAMAVAITGKKSDAEFWLKVYSTFLSNARSNDSKEQETQRKPTNRYAQARR